MYRQVTTLAILLIVQGSLEAIMGLLFAIIGPLMMSIMKTLPTHPGSPPPPEEVGTIVAVYYVLAGGALLATGVLKIVAGAFNAKYKKRGLGIAALATAPVSLFTCYCFPTGLGLM